MFYAEDDIPLIYTNFDIHSVVTPVKADRLNELLIETDYPEAERNFIVKGFKDGFDIGYRGRTDDIQRTAPNLKITVGSETILWNKIMKEVKLKRFAGPFLRSPFKNFIQSPVGLVPKDGGKDTRLIFHLSYPRNGQSVNSETPKEFCTVKYMDFSDAIRRCMDEGISCKMGKSDMKSAFRNLGIRPDQYCWLLIRAKCPLDGQFYWFLDKCLPFGASISCSHFQRISDCIAHIVKHKNKGKIPINYLDDYFFVAMYTRLCNEQIDNFLKVCEEIAFPVSLEKTFWASTILVFLGLLIDSEKQLVAIPADKVERAKILVNQILNKKKAMVKELQKLAGFLNFLCRCIVPGRAFTRRIYSYFSSSMKPHYHINITREIKKDLGIWMEFLMNPIIYCRPFIDYSYTLMANDLDWYTDASGTRGFGGYCCQSYFADSWNKSFLRNCKPSIEFQELFAVTVSVLLWARNYSNRRIRLFCDNKSVVQMINNNTSGCKNCMTLIRRIVKEGLHWNVRIFAKFVETKKNNLADALSRGQVKRFWSDVIKEERTMNAQPESIPDAIWPVEKIWIK